MKTQTKISLEAIAAIAAKYVHVAILHQTCRCSIVANDGRQIAGKTRYFLRLAFNLLQFCKT
jgi:hypothetical protein